MPLYRITNKITAPGAGGDCVNVLHVRTIANLGEPVDANLQEAIDALRTTYASCRNAFAYGAVVQVADSVVADPYGEPTFPQYTLPVGTGPDEGGVAPPHLAIVVGLRTGSATRAGRGRVFLGPLNSLALQASDGTIASDRLSMVRTAWANFVADSNTANGWNLAVWSGVDSVARDVVSVAVRDSLGVMRSRRP